MAIIDYSTSARMVAIEPHFQEKNLTRHKKMPVPHMAVAHMRNAIHGGVKCVLNSIRLSTLKSNAAHSRQLHESTSILSAWRS